LCHSFPWLAGLLACTVHALVAVFPWLCHVPPHRAISYIFQYHILSLALL
jgi:hypothetical protein